MLHLNWIFTIQDNYLLILNNLHYKQNNVCMYSVPVFLQNQRFVCQLLVNYLPLLDVSNKSVVGDLFIQPASAAVTITTENINNYVDDDDDNDADNEGCNNADIFSSYIAKRTKLKLLICQTDKQQFKTTENKSTSDFITNCYFISGTCTIIFL